MRAKFCAFAFAVLFAVTLAPTAHADTFTFNVDFCTNPCLGGVPASNNGGTVAVTQSATNIVDVTVTLANGLLFHDQGLTSFAFNITSNPALSLVSTLTASGQISIVNAGGSTWAFNQPGGNADGAAPGTSNFGYSFDCAAGAGHCSGSPSIFEFRIDLTGITPASLETRSGSTGTTAVDFAANVANGTCTGVIGAGNGTSQSTPSTANTGTPCALTTTPEPGMIGLFGVGLAGVLAFFRRRLFS